MTGKERLSASDLPKVSPFKIKGTLEKVVGMLNDIPEVPPAYPERWQNR